jgi:hypothetical protein
MKKCSIIAVLFLCSNLGCTQIVNKNVHVRSLAPSASIAVEYSGPYGYGFKPLPYPYLGWDGSLSNWLAGDFDFDGDVDEHDLEPFELCYSGPGMRTPWPNYPVGPPIAHNACWLADFNNDGRVDMIDFSVLQTQMGKSLPKELFQDHVAF